MLAILICFINNVNASQNTNIMDETKNFCVKSETPKYISAGSTINVTMHINASNITTLGVNQVNPEGWNISDVECGGHIFSRYADKRNVMKEIDMSWNGSIEWIFWGLGWKTGDFDCTYKLKIPSNAYGEYDLFGLYFKEITTSYDIEGDQKIFVHAPTTTLFEVQDDINKWVNGEITIDKVLTTIEQWSNEKA